MQVTVRRGTAGDAHGLAMLRWRWARERRADTDVDGAPFLAHFAAWVVEHLATHLPFVAEVDGRLSGMAWLVLGERVPSAARPDRRTGDVQAVYVVPERRNAAVGAALLAAIIQEARERRLEHVTVHSAQRAVPLYLRAGFADGQPWLEWRP